jgi:hypothetical protein
VSKKTWNKARKATIVITLSISDMVLSTTPARRASLLYLCLSGRKERAKAPDCKGLLGDLLGVSVDMGL